MKVAFVLGSAPADVSSAPQAASSRSPVLSEAISLLREWGAQVTILYPDDDLTRISELRVDHDLYILRSGTERALRFAGVLDSLGASVLNSYAATRRCRDTGIAIRTLQSQGIPVAKTFLTAGSAQVAPLLADGPLVARRLFCLGGHLFGVKRVRPAGSSANEVGEPFTITPQLRKTGLRCAHAFGLEFFGLDLIVSQGHAYVLEVDPFPEFNGVPDAGLRLADWIFAVSRQSRPLDRELVV